MSLDLASEPAGDARPPANLPTLLHSGSVRDVHLAPAMFDDQDDDVTEFEDFGDPATVFDPNPWGARHRVLPRSTFVPGPVRARPPAAPPPVPRRAIHKLDEGASSLRERPGPGLPALLVPSLATSAVALPAPRTWMPELRAPSRIVTVRPASAQLSPLRVRVTASLVAISVVLALAYVGGSRPGSSERVTMKPSLPSAAIVPMKPSLSITPIDEAPSRAAPSPDRFASPSAGQRPATPTFEPIEPTVPTVPAEAERSTQLAQDTSPAGAKPPRTRRVAKRGPIKLDALDTATPLGRLRPGARR